MGGEELKWCQPAYRKLWRHQGPHFSPHSTAKTTIKAHSSGRRVSSGTSDVVNLVLFWLTKTTVEPPRKGHFGTNINSSALSPL